MYPQAFLKTFWRLELRPQVFVAMSFDPKYNARFNDVIAPAIRSVEVDGNPLVAHRVDTSKSGDSILTQIVDGIAHSQLVLADVSSVGKDSVTGYPYRNGNVMYEVGLALACRAPEEVLLVRDDHDKFLFDTSTIPHMTIDFTDEDGAGTALHNELAARLQQRNLLHDARVELAVGRLTGQEVHYLTAIHALGPDGAWGADAKGIGKIGVEQSVGRLLDKGVIRLMGRWEDGEMAYALTPLGRVVAERAVAEARHLKVKYRKQGGEEWTAVGTEAEQ